MMQNTKRLRIDVPKLPIKAEKVENVQIDSFVSYQKRQKLKDLEQSLQRSLKLKNSIIIKLQLEKLDWMKKVKELENYITDLKVEKEESSLFEGSKEKLEDLKKIYDEKLKLLQHDRETLIKSFTNKFEDIGKLKLKVKKWKSKYAALDKRKKELADLNREKDKIIILKDKTCDELSKIVQECEANVKEKEIEMENLKTEVDESKLITNKFRQLNEEQKQDAENIKDLVEKNKELLKNIEDLEEKIQALQSENDDLIHLSEVQDQNLFRAKKENSILMEDLEEVKTKITSSDEKETSELSLEVQKLKQTLEDYEAELCGLTEANQEEDKRKLEMITILQKKCAENETLQKEKDETISSLQKVNKKLNEEIYFSNMIQDKDSFDAVKNLESELVSAQELEKISKKIKENKSKEFEALKDELDKNHCEKDLKRLDSSAENDKLKQELKDMKEKMRNIHEQVETINSLQEANKKLKEELNLSNVTHGKDSFDAMYEVITLKKTVKYLESQLVSAQELEKFSKNMLENKNKEFEALKDEMAKNQCEQDINRLDSSAEIEKLKKQIEEMKEKMENNHEVKSDCENKILEATLKKTEELLEIKNKEIHSLTVEALKIRNSYEKLEKEGNQREYSTELEHMRTELMEMKQQLSNKNKEVIEMMEANNKLKAVMDPYNDNEEISSLKKVNKKLKAELFETQIKAKELLVRKKQCIKDLKEKSLKVMKENEELKKFNQMAMSENEELGLDLRKQVESNVSTEEIIDKMREKIKTLESELQNFMSKKTRGNSQSTKVNVNSGDLKSHQGKKRGRKPGQKCKSKQEEKVNLRDICETVPDLQSTKETENQNAEDKLNQVSSDQENALYRPLLTDLFDKTFPMISKSLNEINKVFQTPDQIIEESSNQTNEIDSLSVPSEDEDGDEDDYDYENDNADHKNDNDDYESDNIEESLTKITANKIIDLESSPEKNDDSNFHKNPAENRISVNKMLDFLGSPENRNSSNITKSIPPGPPGPPGPSVNPSSLSLDCDVVYNLE